MLLAFQVAQQSKRKVQLGVHGEVSRHLFCGTRNPTDKDG